MIRTSKHILKYQTDYKNNILDLIYDDYTNCLKFYIELIISEELPLEKFLSCKQLPSYSNIVKSHWKSICYKQASGIIRSNIKFQSNKRYARYKKVYSYFRSKNRQIKFLEKKFSDLKLKSLIKYVKINPEKISIDLEYRLFNIEIKNSEHFDEFIQINTPYLKEGSKTRYQTIKLPLKHHKHSNKFKDWNRKNTIQLSKINDNYYINIFYEKEQPEIKSNGHSLGLDCGYKKLITTSDNQIIGKEMEYLYKSISQKQQGSVNFNHSLVERDKLINQFCNELDLSDINHLVVEDLKNVKHKSSGKIRKQFNNKLQRWSYIKVLTKLERLCEENGVQFTKVNPAYTSQTCSSCGTIDKTNRKGEVYQYKFCGVEMDADINASINILHRGVGNFTDIIPLPQESLLV